jgi:hypothetical protein
MIDLVSVNRLLTERKFLSGPSDESFFSHLTCQIQGLARPGEKLVLPEFNEASAWKKAWSLYTALQIRLPDAASKEAEAISRAAIADNRLWGEFVADVEGLRQFRENNRFQWGMLAERAGLQDGDLLDPMAGADEHFGRPPNWGEKARRIGGALRELQGLTPERRREIPAKVEERRLRAHLSKTEARLSAMEQRLAAIESRLPSQKEVTSAVAA